LVWLLSLASSSGDARKTSLHICPHCGSSENHSSRRAALLRATFPLLRCDLCRRLFRVFPGYRLFRGNIYWRFGVAAPAGIRRLKRNLGQASSSRGSRLFRIGLLWAGALLLIALLLAVLVAGSGPRGEALIRDCDPAGSYFCCPAPSSAEGGASAAQRKIPRRALAPVRVGATLGTRA
jgi:hypothetical protein